jgi:uncharacterized protein YqjF (DUF2071 family)
MTRQPTLDDRLATRDRPRGRPAMYQSWQNLLFLHWRFDPDVVQRSLPEGLTVDTHDGAAWVGIVPFYMRNIRPWWFRTVPGISNFLEVNLRTYVYDCHGTPGVWFYSLDANQGLAVKWGRGLFSLPYWPSRMSAVEGADGAIDFCSHRTGTDPALATQFRYRAASPPRHAAPGSLEFFLVERYILFARGRRGGLFSGQVYHPPYAISDAEVSRSDDHLIAISSVGLPRPDRPFDHALLSRGVDVDVFPLLPVI